MSKGIKNQKDMLAKLGITQLNPMQEEARAIIHASAELVLLSPTGSGKTLAFLLPIIAELDPLCREVQALIIVPSRELAIQIEQVIRNIGSGYKANAAYGGQSFNQDTINIKHRPAILVGTPGRISDHLRRRTFETDDIKVLVLDEFDKSLEIGFEKEMKYILSALTKVKKKILTSATHGLVIPEFVGLEHPKFVNYLEQGESKLSIKTVISPSKDKLDTLYQTLCHIGNKPGIIFLNFKDSIQRVSAYLSDKGIAHGCFHGGMEQKERERSLIKFRNGTHQIILSTDLASRGLDVPEIQFIIHYHLPNRPEEFTHRNGRTARMHASGTAYVLKWANEKLPDFIGIQDIQTLELASQLEIPEWRTIFISGGRRDKISKGDIAGLFMKQGKLEKEELGQIELKQDCAFVAVHHTKAEQAVGILNGVKLKKRKIRVYAI